MPGVTRRSLGESSPRPRPQGENPLTPGSRATPWACARPPRPPAHPRDPPPKAARAATPAGSAGPLAGRAGTPPAHRPSPPGNGPCPVTTTAPPPAAVRAPAPPSCPRTGPAAPPRHRAGGAVGGAPAADRRPDQRPFADPGRQLRPGPAARRRADHRYPVRPHSAATSPPWAATPTWPPWSPPPSTRPPTPPPCCVPPCTPHRAGNPPRSRAARHGPRQPGRAGPHPPHPLVVFQPLDHHGRGSWALAAPGRQRACGPDPSPSGPPVEGQPGTAARCACRRLHPPWPARLRPAWAVCMQQVSAWLPKVIRLAHLLSWGETGTPARPPMTRRADTGVMRLTGRDVAGLVLCADMTARGTWPHHQAGERPDAPGQGREGGGRGGWFFSHLRRGGTLRGLPAGFNGQQEPAPRAATA